MAISLNQEEPCKLLRILYSDIQAILPGCLNFSVFDTFPSFSPNQYSQEWGLS